MKSHHQGEPLKFETYYPKSNFENAAVSVGPVESLDGKAVERFSEFMLRTLDLVRLESTGDLYVFNHDMGRYEFFEPWKAQVLFKHLMNRIGVPWKRFYETEILGALTRSVTKTVPSFNTENAMNFRNGVFDLTTGAFMEHSPQTTYFTTVLGYDYAPDAKCPRFEQFIAETACGDNSLCAIIQEMFGYCCSTEIRAEKAFFCYGTGSNGKSILGRVLTSIVGPDFTCGVSLEMLNKPFALSAFIGKRLNISAENEYMPNSERLKAIISGDRLNIPIKYKEDASCELFAKNVFLMNSLPTTKDVSPGFFRKILLIPFENTVPPERMDKDLFDKLLEERSGIFNWAYEGYKRLQENNFVFTSSEKAERLMDEYVNRENPTGEFFQSTYEASTDSRIQKERIYRDYCDWAEINGYRVMDLQKFYKALKLKAAEPGSDIHLVFTKSGNDRFLLGYKLRAELVLKEGGQEEWAI